MVGDGRTTTGAVGAQAADPIPPDDDARVAGAGAGTGSRIRVCDFDGGDWRLDAAAFATPGGDQS